MKYWICVTNEKSWETVRDEHIWGSDTNKVKEITKGDKAIIYVMETKKGETVIPPRVKGSYDVVSEPYEDRERIFSGGVYPNRVRLEPEIVLTNEYVDFRDLVSDLEFIKNKRYWSGYFRAGINDMPKHDYELIKKTLEQQKGT